MKLEYNEEQLLELMKDFYISSGIRIVLFDDEYQKLLSYPKEDCCFCQAMKAHQSTRSLCSQSDTSSFQQCKEQQKLIIYHCHAGLIEAAIPLKDNHIIIGYLMFGQISDCPNTKTLETVLTNYLNQHTLTAASALSEVPAYSSASAPSITSGIALKTKEQIQAAAKIMEACTFYALFNETIAFRRQNFTNNLRSFLLEHITEDLDAQTIAHHLGISRSKLYLACDKYLGIGIGEYTRKLRIEKAQTLLQTTEKTITEISADVGFHDYNYFCKVFKKITGMTPFYFRKSKEMVMG